jgi:hypothetical protein
MSSEGDIKRITNDLLKTSFATEIGQKAIVERTPVEQDERTEQLRSVLQDVGRDFLETGKAPKGMEYWGSVAVHIYAAPVTGVFANIKQIAPTKCPDELLVRAVDDLRRGVLTYIGKEGGKLRSGF